MNPQITAIPAAQLYGNYTLWNPVEETWSPPMSYTAAVEAYARDPELQASLILPDGTTTAPAQMAEIIKRAHTASTLPRDLKTASAIQERANAKPAAQAEEHAHDTPAPDAQQAQPPSASPETTQQLAAIREQLATLTRAAVLYTKLTFLAIDLAGIGLIIGGLAGSNIPFILAGLILLGISAYLHKATMHTPEPPTANREKRLP